MKIQTTTHYEVQVNRAGTMIAYSAERYPSLADARVEGRRLLREGAHRPAETYVEIRKVEVKRTATFVERMEGADA